MVERRGMSQQHLAHAIFLHPINTERRVDIGVVITGQETVTFDPPPSHDDEDAECRVRDGKSRGLSFRQRAGQKINAFDIPINFFQLDRKSTRSELQSLTNLVCRLLLEKKK